MCRGGVGRLEGRWEGVALTRVLPGVLSIVSLFQSHVVLSGKQERETKLRTSGIIVPPPSPEHSFEQPNSEFLPFLNQFDTLPPDLLKE